MMMLLLLLLLLHATPHSKQWTITTVHSVRAPSILTHMAEFERDESNKLNSICVIAVTIMSTVITCTQYSINSPMGSTGSGV